MTSGKKYFAAAALAVSAMTAAAPADAQLAPNLRSLEVIAHWADIRSSYTRLENKIAATIKTHKYAEDKNNDVLLSHTREALIEIYKRIVQTCNPLYEQAGRDIFEEAKNSPKIGDKASDSFKKLHHDIMAQCDADSFPSVRIEADGTILSDVTLNRRNLELWGVKISLATSEKALKAITDFKRALNTSGVTYLKRQERYMDQMQIIEKECKKTKDAYIAAVRSSNDLIELRRYKGRLERICNKEPRI